MKFSKFIEFFKDGILIFIFTIFSGCVDIDSVKSRLIPSKPEESYIQATRKSELVFDETTRIVLIAVHLNTFDEQKYPHEKGEIFFIDVYQSAQNSKGFLENNYRLSLSNGESPFKITRLQKEDLQDFMLQNAMRWGEYYLVEFAPQDKRVQDSLTLVLSHPEFGENILKFGFKGLSKEELRGKDQ